MRSLSGSATVELEATGHCWLALYSFLSELGQEVIVLNPLQIHAYRQSGIRMRKSDRFDAYWIADCFRLGGIE